MDPLTLFALANGAVAAVKAGCELYKEIKGAVGDVKDILKDLDDQFHSAFAAKGKTPSTEQKNHFIKTKNKVIINNKKAIAGEHTNIYADIGHHLGTYFDNYNKCKIVFEEEEKKAKTQIYTGDDSLGKRALQRVLMKKQLEQMGKELREIMIYQSPPELGALWTEVNDMMEVIGKQQKDLIIKQIQQQDVNERRKQTRIKKIKERTITGISILFLIFIMIVLFMFIAYDRSVKYPQYGTGFFPTTEEERREESEPKRYVGR
jgi:hypothetical protein